NIYYLWTVYVVFHGHRQGQDCWICQYRGLFAVSALLLFAARSIIYLYYQQNHPSIDKRSYDDLIKDLKRQVQHYQKLYEDRVAKDLGLERKDKEIQVNFPDSRFEKLKNDYQEFKKYLDEILKELGYNSWQELKERVKYLQKKDKNIKEKLEKKLDELEKVLKDVAKQNEEVKEENKRFFREAQERLRKINLLFDPSAANYEVIDFNNLYELLK
ncbi:2975_t:CDS:2, partial [Cetraspora pellucida]